jgi:4a-hydroxytetrahydrobiopterin dehydratase
MAKLSAREIEAVLAEQPQWRLEGGALTRDWTFQDFVEAMAFVNRVAALAEEANHHPDMDIRYNKVRLALVSHDAGGITERDSQMAAKISGAL